MIDSVAETFHAIVSVKTQVAVIALVLTGFAVLFIKNATDSTGFAALFVPAIGFGCLAGVYGMKMVGITLSTSRNANIIASAGVGMVIAFLLMVVVIRVFGAVRDISRPIDLAGRVQELD